MGIHGPTTTIQGTMKMSGAIIVFAKCPIPGASKTRLSGLLGVDGSARMAKAMLSDVLLSLSHDVSACVKEVLLK